MNGKSYLHQILFCINPTLPLDVKLLIEGGSKELISLSIFSEVSRKYIQAIQPIPG
jgi:hypothetical protein